ncbi:PucR family transcriptional regulator [Butyrivibrio sp. VCD2006]|uniref:PucR family transcriptional regulator n=1 Tax=Butyrivibrio sp. VCD2006 TaxID=1280664 RepID=UPI0003F77662|nr:helix-turn-helix domain-containing protein [Butyrivibrio sp. VCD2006]
MNFTEIAKIMEKSCDCSVNIGKENPEITHFSFLSGGEQPNDTSCLYIGDIDVKNLRDTERIPCLLTTTKGVPCHVSYIYTSKKELMNCMNVLTSAFFRSNDNESRFRHLKGLAKENVSISELINKSALFLDRSMVLTDLGFKVLEHSTSVSITDPLWQRYIEKGSCTFEFINAMNELMPAQSLPKTSACFQVTCTSSTEEKLCSQLFIGNRPVAYLVLLDNNRGLTAFHREYLPKISEFLSAFISMHNTYPDISKNDTEFYIKLLDGSEEEINKISESKAALAKHTFCMVLKAIHHSRHELFFIKRTLDGLIPGNVIFIYRELIVVISSDSGIIDSIENNEEVLKNVSEIGISAEFNSVALFPENFQLAQEACRIGKQIGASSKVHRYENYRFLHLLNHVSDVGLLKSYIHPALYRLHHYDLEHDSELVETLKVFLRVSCSVKDASDALFLHRNTLNYRMSKITELTGLDLNDAETVFRLQCSYQINGILHLF